MQPELEPGRKQGGPGSEVTQRESLNLLQGSSILLTPYSCLPPAQVAFPEGLDMLMHAGDHSSGEAAAGRSSVNQRPAWLPNEMLCETNENKNFK